MSATAQTSPLVSVVVPLYNHAKYVRTCLDSIVSSRYRPLQILVLDDGSTDGSFSIAREWAQRLCEPNIQIFVERQDNQGLTKTLNRLVQMARGEFIALIASDDFLLPDGIRARVEALRQHPEWRAVFADSTEVDENGSQIRDSYLRQACHTSVAALLNPKYIAAELILRWGIPGGSFMARREIYDPANGVGLYDETLPFEDRDFLLRALAGGVVGFVDLPVSAYRQHRANFFKSANPERLASYLEGIYLSELKNIRRFRGFARLSLSICLRIAHADFMTQKGVPHRSRMYRSALLCLKRTLYRVHRLRVCVSRPVYH